MKKTNQNFILLTAFLIVALSSCTTLNKTMKESNTLVELKKTDFTLSEQVTGNATQMKILGIDWGRLFKKEKGATIATPLIGNKVNVGKVESYALHDMLSSNMGHDVVFYPSFEKSRFNLLFLYIKTEVTVRGRLGKLNRE
ncbi:DUF6567 family protein [Aurantibacillus circumpalustris]|uniref:DUF6567 family protein n=1 Tax=Aurantibacillus circumpalustris TaxID=3036359 RepID=UPI00295B4E06|nr:DUF6567 family protein [Aurantibacillus circumpalustris]